MPYKILILIYFIMTSCSVQAIREIPTPESLPIANQDIYYGRSLLNTEQQKAYDTIRTGYRNFTANRDQFTASHHRVLFDFKRDNISITQSDLTTIVQYVDWDNPDLYIKTSLPRDIVIDNGFVSSFYLQVKGTYTPETYKQEMLIIDESVQKILNQISSKMTDREKFKIAHDEFIKSVTYGGMSDVNSGNMLGAFKNKKVICDGYAQAFLYILQKLGFKALYITGNAQTSPSSSVLHAWNKVQIDGQWYNVDTTWNDPALGSGVDVIYNYYLKLDNEFTQHTPNSAPATYSQLPATK